MLGVTVTYSREYYELAEEAVRALVECDVFGIEYCLEAMREEEKRAKD